MIMIRRSLVALAVLAAGTSSLFASEGGADGSELIKPNYGTIFWTTVTFLIFAFLLSKYAWKPLMGALDARESSIRKSIETAKNDREEAERVQQRLNQAWSRADIQLTESRF